MYVYHGIWREDSREGISAATQSFSPHNLHWANYNKDKSAMSVLKCLTSSSCSNSPTFWFNLRQLDCGHSDPGEMEVRRDPQYVGDCLYWDTDTLLHVRHYSTPGVATLNYHPATPSTELRPAFRFHWLRESYTTIFLAKCSDLSWVYWDIILTDDLWGASGRCYSLTVGLEKLKELCPSFSAEDPANSAVLPILMTEMERSQLRQRKSRNLRFVKSLSQPETPVSSRTDETCQMSR